MPNSASPYLKHTFNNGVQVIAEKFDTVQSVSIGFFLKSGVLYEAEHTQGVSHFIEHMLFKGTIERSAKQIAREFDRIGGYLNAFTAKDYCCFYARVVKDKIDVAIDVLSDMIKNATFVEEEFERERKVILEEIKMYEDSPDEIIHELLGQNLWRNSKLGKPILGTSKSVANMNRDEVFEVFKNQYVSKNIIVCAAGNFDWEHLKDAIGDKLGDLRPGNLEAQIITPDPAYEASIYQKDIEQVHLTIGAPGVAFADSRRYPLTILNASFGGGMSSRLFQEIREKRGLAYTVYSYHTSFRNSGLFGIYAGTSMQHLQDVLELCFAELKKLSQDGLTETEISETKDQLKGNMLIALESTTNRMNRLATEFLYGVTPKTPELSIEPYMKVTSNDIIEAVREILDEKRMAITMVAPDLKAGVLLENSSFSTRPIKNKTLGSNFKE